MHYAVITTGGKQYIVTEGDKISIEKIPGEAGGAVSFPALLSFDSEGKFIETGKPRIQKQVEGKIVKQGRFPKISVVKFKRKVRYRKIRGHKQHFSEIEITKI